MEEHLWKQYQWCVKVGDFCFLVPFFSYFCSFCFFTTSSNGLWHFAAFSGSNNRSVKDAALLPQWNGSCCRWVSSSSSSMWRLFISSCERENTWTGSAHAAERWKVGWKGCCLQWERSAFVSHNGHFLRVRASCLHLVNQLCSPSPPSPSSSSLAVSCLAPTPSTYALFTRTRRMFISRQTQYCYRTYCFFLFSFKLAENPAVFTDAIKENLQMSRCSVVNSTQLLAP